MDNGHHTQRVLVVDDERLIADSLAIILNRSGFEASAAYSGEMALQIAPAFKPDLLISDVIMSGISGIEAAIQVQADFPSCKVLLFSGQAATSSLLAEARARNYDFELILKPIHPSDLIAKLRDVVADATTGSVHIGPAQ